MGVKMKSKNIFYYETKESKERVKQLHQRRGLKKVPQYHWHKHWASSGTDILEYRFKMGVPSPLNKPLIIGGKSIFI